MASSSVSQDDIDNDFEKNSRRSRIRTARARQINPSGCRLESSQNQQNNVLDQDSELGSGTAGAAGACEEENGTGGSILNASGANSGVNPGNPGI